MLELKEFINLSFQINRGNICLSYHGIGLLTHPPQFFNTWHQKSNIFLLINSVSITLLLPPYFHLGIQIKTLKILHFLDAATHAVSSKNITNQRWHMK